MQNQYLQSDTNLDMWSNYYSSAVSPKIQLLICKGGILQENIEGLSTVVPNNRLLLMIIQVDLLNFKTQLLGELCYLSSSV